MPLTALPTPPSTSDPANFATRADAFVAALATMVTEINGGGIELVAGTLTGDLKFTDAIYDIGKSGATRPRDLFLSRNATIGGTLAVSGAATVTTNNSGGQIIAAALSGETSAFVRLSPSAAGANLRDWAFQSYTLTEGTASIKISATKGGNPTAGTSVMDLTAAGIDVPGTLSNSGHGTTASAANAFIATSGGLISRSTSSMRYKRDWEPMTDERIDAIFKLKAGWYRSLSPLDDPAWSFYGFSAEDTAPIDPRWVHWYRPVIGQTEAVTEDYEVDEPVLEDQPVQAIEMREGRAVLVTRVEKSPVIDVMPVFLEDGSALMHGDVQVTVRVERTQKVKKTRVVTPSMPIYGEPIPDGVQYERMVVPLIARMGRLIDEFDAYKLAHP